MSLITVPGVNGLYLIVDVFDQPQLNYFTEILLNDTHGHPCRQIHAATEYGWKFLPLRDNNHIDIKLRTSDDYLGEYPDWIQQIWNLVLVKLSDIEDLPSTLRTCASPDNLLINKYVPGDGVIPHTDELEFWEDWVVGVSFGSGCVFNYSLNKEKVSMYIPANSIYVLTKDARYKWKHGIAFVKEDIVYGDVIPRTTRISMTFRNIDKRWLTDEVRNNTVSNIVNMCEIS